MSFSSGTFSLYTPGNPVVTGTTIASTWANNTLNDIATGLSTCVLKDGTQTITANIPMGGFKFTGLAAGSASGNSIRYEQVLGVVTTAGDILYATAAGTLARLAIGTADQPLVVNSGATAPQWGFATKTANTVLAGPTSGGAAAPTFRALVNADIAQLSITLGTEQATTSGTSIDFTGIPTGVKQIRIMFVSVSTSGTNPLLLQIGDAGGIETSGYLGTGSALAAAAQDASNSTTAFAIGDNSAAAANIYHGCITLSLEDSSDFTWVCSGTLGLSNAAQTYQVAGSKATSAVLDRVRITTVGASDTFDAGVINIQYFG